MSSLLDNTIFSAFCFVGTHMQRNGPGHDTKTLKLGGVEFVPSQTCPVVSSEDTQRCQASRLQHAQGWFRAVFLTSTVLALALHNPAWASHAPSHKSVGSYDVNIGVVPAAQAQLSAPQMGSAEHREAARRGDYHLVASVRDIKSGQVVANATIRAEVGPLGMSAQTKSLDAMIVNGETSYGNYFAIPGRDSYTVHLWIEGPAALSAHSEAVFTVRRN